MTYRATAGVKPRQGNSRFLLVADRKIDARSQTQDSPRRTSGHAAQIRGSELDHRRLKASPLPLHDHNFDGSQHRLWREDSAVASTLDKGHQSKIDRRSSAQGHSLRLRHLHLFPLIPRERRYSGHGRTYVVAPQTGSCTQHCQSFDPATVRHVYLFRALQKHFPGTVATLEGRAHPRRISR